MKINKVKLHNFSSYEGNNEFDFEITDAGKNIVLIGGKNGAGKTSLFTAIKVALYGPLAYGYVGVNSHYISKIKDLINSKAFQQEVVESEVQLVKMLEGTSINVLKNKSESDFGQEPIRLYKKIELGRLSKGERQIFILALYWAIIEISGQNVPFIIDTPYARIDANHRREISEKFFPNISDQVIILSTDEEINEEYYKIVKPYVSKEYLLINDENENRTTIKNNYFFEV